MPRTAPTHRIDSPAFWRALDTRRRQLDLSWRAVARQTGLSISTLVRLQNAELGLHGDAFVALLVWLGRDEPLRDLITGARGGRQEPPRSAAAEALAHQLRHATVAELDEALRLVGVTITLAVTEDVDPS